MADYQCPRRHHLSITLLYRQEDIWHECDLLDRSAFAILALRLTADIYVDMVANDTVLDQHDIHIGVVTRRVMDPMDRVYLFVLQIHYVYS